MGRLLVGLTGTAGSGKTAVADYLLERYGLLSLTVANPIKRMLDAGLGLSREQLFGEEREQPMELLGGLTPRELFRSLGDWGRAQNPDLWLWQLERELDDLALFTQNPGAVVADIRLEREAEWVRDEGGHLIHLYRPGVDPDTDHITEQGVRRLDGEFALVNAGTLEALFARVDDVITEIKH